MGRAIGTLRAKASWTAALVVGSITVEALAAQAHKPGSETWTEVAGSKGASTVELLTTADYYGLEALKIWEYDARPCVLQIEQGSFNTQSVGVLEPVKVCEPKATENWKRADVGAGQFVTGISVCTAQGKDATPEIHGVELWGAVLGENAKIKPGSSVKFAFPRCDKWSPRRSCPWGSVATGLRTEIQGERGAVGIALRCHKLVAR